MCVLKHVTWLKTRKHFSWKVGTFLWSEDIRSGPHSNKACFRGIDFKFELELGQDQGQGQGQDQDQGRESVCFMWDHNFGLGRSEHPETTQHC